MSKETKGEGKTDFNELIGIIIAMMIILLEFWVIWTRGGLE